MAIDPYEPELAKRKTAFQIAQSQLAQITSKMSRVGDEFHQQLSQADEALKDYRETSHSLGEWIKKKDEDLNGGDWPPQGID